MDGALAPVDPPGRRRRELAVATPGASTPATTREPAQEPARAEDPPSNPRGERL